MGERKRGKGLQKHNGSFKQVRLVLTLQPLGKQKAKERGRKEEGGREREREKERERGLTEAQWVGAAGGKSLSKIMMLSNPSSKSAWSSSSSG